MLQKPKICDVVPETVDTDLQNLSLTDDEVWLDEEESSLDVNSEEDYSI